MTGGDVLIQDAIWEHNRPLLAKLQEMGVEVIDEGIRISFSTRQTESSSCQDLTTSRVFPTDMRSSIYCSYDGCSRRINYGLEQSLKSRFQHLEGNKNRMGLHSEIIRDTTRIVKVQPLQGAEVLSTGLRASAAA